MYVVKTFPIFRFCVLGDRSRIGHVILRRNLRDERQAQAGWDSARLIFGDELRDVFIVYRHLAMRCFGVF